jgi:hypothetical protein
LRISGAPERVEFHLNDRSHRAAPIEAGKRIDKRGFRLIAFSLCEEKIATPIGEEPGK